MIAFTSGKGGTGKSCVAAYTACALAKAGKKTLLLEIGRDPRSLDLILGVADSIVFNLSDVVAGRCDRDKAVIDIPSCDGLSLLPAGLYPLAPKDGDALERLMKSLESEYEYVVADGVDFTLLSPKSARTIVIVTTPDSLSIRACSAQARILAQAGANLRLCINNVPPRVMPIHGAEDFDDVIDMIGAQLIGVIPASPKLQHSACTGRPLSSETLTWDVLDNIAARLRGQQRPLIIR